MADYAPVTRRPPRLLPCSLVLALLACERGAPRPPEGAAPAIPQADSPPLPPRGQLARVRPAAPPCTSVRHPPPELLLERAEEELERGDALKALTCAEEAVRSAPRAPAALHLRAAALAALKRVDEARIAYAHALAVDPDDPETLRGAADLYVMQDGERISLLVGREYALRGARAALRPARRDPDLAAGLLSLAASAENDLGENREALSHADAALRLRPAQEDALYERGVALYELCRFGEARAALEAVVRVDPDDAWALYYLSLVAERTGDAARATTLERRARRLAPDDLPTALDVDPASFEQEVRRAVAALPDRERVALRDIPIEVAEVPGLDDLTATDPPLSPSILGLFRGPSEQQACTPDEGPRCRSIVFYRRNLLRFVKSRPELEEQVRVTLLHELGHLHGESDDDLRARGLE